MSDSEQTPQLHLISIDFRMQLENVIHMNNDTWGL